MTTLKTFKSAQEALEVNSEMYVAPIYVFKSFFSNNQTVEGYDAVEVVYADREADKVRYGRKSYNVVGRQYGCGVTYVKCIFI